MRLFIYYNISLTYKTKPITVIMLLRVECQVIVGIKSTSTSIRSYRECILYIRITRTRSCNIVKCFTAVKMAIFS